VFHVDVLLNLVDRVRAGQALVTFVPLYGTGSISNGERAARAAVCAAQQDAFWVMSDILFDRQGTLRNQAFTIASLSNVAAAVGLDEADWQECLDSDLPGEVLAAAQASAEAESVTDTPTVLVDGEPVDADLNSVNAAIDAAL
jgi:protein-disulfide isomerase